MKRIIIPLIIILAIEFLLAYFLCDIKPATEYGYFAGIWHGLFVIPNAILHIFNHGILFFSDIASFAYKIGFGIGLILNTVIGEFINIVSNLGHDDKE